MLRGICRPRCLALIAIAALGASTSAAWSNQMEIAGRQKPVRLVCSSSPEEREMADYLRKFLRERGFSVEPRPSVKYDARYRGPQWILGISSTADSLGFKDRPKFGEKDRDEAFVLSVSEGNVGPVVGMIGKTPSGLRAAVVRLIGRSANYGSELRTESGIERKDPFILERMLAASNSPRRQVPMGSPFREADCQTWSLDRLKAYPELFWQFGYNWMQLDEDRGYGSATGEDLKRIQRALKAMAIGARQYHLSVSMSQWGDCIFNEGETYSWNDTKQHAVMQSFMDELAGNYAALVDNVTIHIGDPGGCTRDGCDLYKTPQQVTAGYLAAFKKINPKVSGSITLWANGNLWQYSPKKLDLSNYDPPFPGMAQAQEFGLPIPDGAKFLDGSFMPRDVSISLNRCYNSDQAESVRAAGREVGIESWYVADMEMVNNICINMHTVDQVVGMLPDKARDEVKLETIELCFDGWPQLINQYVGGQKLWDPRRPLREIEKEFCTAAFGPSNADAMIDVYEACENGDPKVSARPIPSPDDFGTAEYNARLRKVFAEAETVKLSPDWKPNFAFPVPVQKFVDMMTARLQLIIAVSEAREKYDAAKKRGGTSSELAQVKIDALRSLPYLPIDPLFRQDESIVRPVYRSCSFAEMIQEMQ